MKTLIMTALGAAVTTVAIAAAAVALAQLVPIP